MFVHICWLIYCTYSVTMFCEPHSSLCRWYCRIVCSTSTCVCSLSARATSSAQQINQNISPARCILMLPKCAPSVHSRRNDDDDNGGYILFQIWLWVVVIWLWAVDCLTTNMHRFGSQNKCVCVRVHTFTLPVSRQMRNMCAQFAVLVDASIKCADITYLHKRSGVSPHCILGAMAEHSISSPSFTSCGIYVIFLSPMYSISCLAIYLDAISRRSSPPSPPTICRHVYEYFVRVRRARFINMLMLPPLSTTHVHSSCISQ